MEQALESADDSTKLAAATGHTLPHGTSGSSHYCAHGLYKAEHQGDAKLLFKNNARTDKSAGAFEKGRAHVSGACMLWSMLFGSVFVFFLFGETCIVPISQ